MSLTTRVGLLAGASALTLTGASFADNPTEAQSWEARVAELEAEVAQLKGDNWITEQRSDEIRAIVQDVLADADTRASLLQSGMTAGYDNGFVIGSPDGNFSLKINGYIQFRWVYSNLEEPGLASLDQDDYDFFWDPAAPENWGSGLASWADLYAGFIGVDDPMFTYDFPGGVNFYAAVYAQLTAAQQAEVDTMVTDLEAVNLGQALGWDASTSAALRTWMDNRFDAFTTAQKNAVAAGLGMTLEDGTVITTWQQFQGLMGRYLQTLFKVDSALSRNNDEHRYGFEVRRARLSFSGHIIDPTWMYRIYGDFDRDGGAFELLEAWIAKDLGEGWTAKFGQMPVPFLREFLVGHTKQLAVDRSLLHSYFTATRGQGVALDYMGDMFHFTAAFTDGANSLNTAWQDEDTEFALTGRAELKWAGNWNQFADFTSPQGSEYAGMAGVALHYQQQERGTGIPDLFPHTGQDDSINFNNEQELFALTVDASVELDGANLYGAFIYQSLDSDLIDYDRYGFLVQGGYYFTEDWEGFVRYEWADFDMPDLYWPGNWKVYSFDDLSVLTLGVNKYFAGHNVKWTTDLGYAFDRVEFFAADSGAGYRSDTGGDNGQIVFRTQLQLAF